MVLWGRASVGEGREAPLVSHRLWNLDFPVSASYQYEVKGFTNVIYFVLIRPLGRAFKFQI